MRGRSSRAQRTSRSLVGPALALALALTLALTLTLTLTLTSVLTLSAYDFRVAATRVKRHNAPVWRKYMRYVVVSEEVRCCGGEVCCGLLRPRFSSFEFPPSRIVGICLVHKVAP